MREYPSSSCIMRFCPIASDRVIAAFHPVWDFYGVVVWPVRMLTSISSFDLMDATSSPESIDFFGNQPSPESGPEVPEYGISYEDLPPTQVWRHWLNPNAVGFRAERWLGGDFYWRPGHISGGWRHCLLRRGFSGPHHVVFDSRRVIQVQGLAEETPFCSDVSFDRDHILVVASIDSMVVRYASAPRSGPLTQFEWRLMPEPEIQAVLRARVTGLWTLRPCSSGMLVSHRHVARRYLIRNDGETVAVPDRVGSAGVCEVTRDLRFVIGVPGPDRRGPVVTINETPIVIGTKYESVRHIRLAPDQLSVFVSTNKRLVQIDLE